MLMILTLSVVYLRKMYLRLKYICVFMPQAEKREVTREEETWTPLRTCFQRSEQLTEEEGLKRNRQSKVRRGAEKKGKNDLPSVLTAHKRVTHMQLTI